MFQPRKTELFHVPAQLFVEAEIVPLTPQLADHRMHAAWWDDDCLKGQFDDPQPIDRHWNWNEVTIDLDGRLLDPVKVAVVAGDDRAVQGAMMMSADAVESVLHPGDAGLFVELLFVAPRNRPRLRRDGREFLKGIGLELLTWAAWFSREQGHGGRLRLESSPECVRWYEKRGLRSLRTDPIYFEGVEYTPMELDPPTAQKLLDPWDNAGGGNGRSSLPRPLRRPTAPRGLQVRPAEGERLLGVSAA